MKSIDQPKATLKEADAIGKQLEAMLKTTTHPRIRKELDELIGWCWMISNQAHNEVVRVEGIGEIR